MVKISNVIIMSWTTMLYSKSWMLLIFTLHFPFVFAISTTDRFETTTVFVNNENTTTQHLDESHNNQEISLLLRPFQKQQGYSQTTIRTKESSPGRSRFLQSSDNIIRTNYGDTMTTIKNIVSMNNIDNDNDDYTSLLEGTIILNANVEEYAKLTYDLRDIRKKVISTTTSYETIMNQIKGIYIEGLNSEISSGRRFALKYLNDDLVNTLSTIGYNSNTFTSGLKSILPSSIITPIYIYQLYGLSLQQRTTIDKVANYAYETIDKLFSLSSTTSSSSTTTTNYLISDAIADAILVQSFWMYSTHILYHGLGICREHVQADDINTIRNKKYGLNTFMALWIGMDQEIGNSNTGYSLYSWTQKISIIFGTIDDNNNEESNVNTQIKLLHYEGQQALALPNACYSSKIENDYSYPSNTEIDLYLVLNRIIQQMMIPLFQYTIYYLLNNNIIALQIYSKALIPQLVRCRPSTYQRLYNNLILSNQNYDTLINEKQDILNDIIAMYTQCFHIKCEDIGNYNNNDGNDITHLCENINNNNNNNNYNQMNNSNSDSYMDDIMKDVVITDDDAIVKDVTIEPYPIFAGYTSSTYVNDLSKIDLDIYQMKILTSNQLYNYARYIYFLGCNVPMKRNNYFDPYQLISLYQLATSSSSTKSSTTNLAIDHPYYSAYLSYYNNHEYMNEQILHALDPNYQFNSTSSSSSSSGHTSVGSYMPFITSSTNRAELLHYTSSYFILFSHIMTLLENTVISCHNNHEKVLQGELDSITLYDLTNPLDEAVALFIGSMEGTLIGGALDVIDEYLLYGLSETRSFQFQTQNDIGYSIANSELLNEFYAAKALLSTLSCSNLQRTITHIQRLMQIGIIQSIIYVSVALTDNTMNAPRNVGTTTATDNSNLIIQGHVLSSIIVSSMNQYDTSMARTFSTNMMNTTGTVHDGAQTIADILGNYLYNSLGLSCQYLGSYSNINPCLHVKGDQGIDTNNNNNGGSSSSSSSSISLRHTIMMMLASWTLLSMMIVVLLP